MKIRLRILDNVDSTADVLAAWEISAFCAREFPITSIEIDTEEAREWFIENRIAPADRESYRAEPEIAEGEMIEAFKSSMCALVSERQSILLDVYPFDLEAGGVLVRRPMSGLTYPGLCYLALQLFRALKAGLLEVDGAEADIKRDKNNFRQSFYKLFEYIAGYAVSSQKNGFPFMLSKSRDSRKLHSLLTATCAKLGAGTVLPHDRWPIELESANDGGVDCMVHVGERPSSGVSEIYLVGATVQEASIDVKIISRDKIDFFERFFITKPAVFTGALVRPQDASELILAKCKAKNCHLYSYSEIWRALGSVGKIERSASKRLDAGVRHLIPEFAKITLLHDYEEYNICDH